MKLNLKVLTLVGCVFLTGATMEAQLLKSLKEKANKAVSDIKGEKKSSKGSADKQSPSTSSKKGSSSPSSQKELEISDMYYNGQEVPSILMSIPMSSNLHEKNDRDFPSEPNVAAGAKAVYVDGSINYYSPFSDGVAYMSSYESGNFFFDKNGTVLFSTPMDVGGDEKAPMFENGVVMEVVKEHGVDGLARIRDKKGNIIKELPKIYEAANFKGGVAPVMYRWTDKDQIDHNDVKYVDTKGNFVFPDIHYSTTDLGILNRYLPLRALNRIESEGLTAFGKVDRAGHKHWGFRDKMGKVVIPAQYDEVGDFHDGLATVKVPGEGGSGAKGRWGFIDKTGKIVIQPKYSNRPSDFNSGLAVVTNRTGESYYIDKTGATKFGPVGNYEDSEVKDGQIVAIGPFLNGYAFVHFVVHYPGYELTQKFVGVIDPSLKIIKWGGLSGGPDNGMVPSGIKDGKCYLINQGASLQYWVELPEMTRPVKHLKDTYSDGLARHYSYNSGGHSGYVNEKGEIVLEVKSNEF